MRQYQKKCNKVTVKSNMNMNELIIGLELLVSYSFIRALKKVAIDFWSYCSVFGIPVLLPSPKHTTMPQVPIQVTLKGKSSPKNTSYKTLNM